MPNIFRKVRKKLIDRDEVTNYLKYAVGEIVLVVIGILIALQINNWNEARQNRAFEITMLKGVEKSIGGAHGDQWYIHNILLRRLAVVDSSSAELQRLIAKRNVPDDSVEKYIQLLDTGILFTYDKGPYDAIKSVGLDKITNDSLRSLMTEVYDFWLPRTKELIALGYGQPWDKADNLENKLFKDTVATSTDGNVYIKRVIRVKRVLQNPDFLEFLRLRTLAARRAEFRLNEVLPDINRLERLLKKELKSDAQE